MFLDANATANELAEFGQGRYFELLSEYFVIFLIIFIGILVLILIPLIIKFAAKKPSKVELQLAEMENEREKFRLLSKQMLEDELDTATMVLKPKEKEELRNLDLDNSILARKLLYTMNEVEKRTKRLEIGTSGAQLADTLEEIKDREQATFGRQNE